jgi:hypothetical protein
MSRRRTNRSSPNADLQESILKHFQTLRVPLSADELDAGHRPGRETAVEPPGIPGPADRPSGRPPPPAVDRAKDSGGPLSRAEDVSSLRLAL